MPIKLHPKQAKQAGWKAVLKKATSETVILPKSHSARKRAKKRSK